jgi:hypothetical protein
MFLLAGVGAGLPDICAKKISPGLVQVLSTAKKQKTPGI